MHRTEQTMRKSLSDIGSGIGFLAIAAAFFFQHDSSTGVSSVFPLLLMGIIAWGGVYYLVRGLLELRRERPHDEAPGGEHWGNIFLVSFMAFAYAAAIPLLGYWWSTGLFLAVTYMGLVFRNGNPARMVLNAVVFGGGFTFLVWLGFVKLMSVPTPEGILW